MSYTVEDANGTPTGATITITVGEPDAVEPVANPDSDTTPQGVPVTIDLLDDDAPGSPDVPLVPAATTLLDAAGEPVDTVTLDSVGVFTVDDAGNVTFTPEPEFTGVTPAVPYRITDEAGSTADSTVTVTVTPVTPAATNDTGTTPFETSITIDPLGNDTAGNPGVPLDPTTVRLTDPDGEPVTSLTTPEGVFEVNPTTGEVTFTPADGFSGPVPSVSYTVEDANGTPTGATITITVGEPGAVNPVANPDSDTTPQGVPITIDLLDDDAPGAPDVPLVPAATTLLDAAGEPVDTVTLDGVGVFTVDDAGNVTFTPEPGFTGQTPAVPYRITDQAGNTADSTVTVTVTPVTPAATADTGSTPFETPFTIDPLGNDTAGNPGVPLDPTTVRLTDPDGEPVTTLTTPEGVFEVDPTTGAVTFTPADGFSGPVPPVGYTVEDANGTPTGATITITVGEPDAVEPVANPDAGSTPHDTPITIDPLENDRPGSPDVPLDPTSVRLVDPATGDPVTRLTTPQGTFTVDPVTGEITFTPADGFSGRVPAISYTVSDVDGNEAMSTITITVGPAGTPGDPDDPDSDGPSPGLPDTGADGGAALAALLAAMLAIGLGAILLVRRRRPTD